MRSGPRRFSPRDLSGGGASRWGSSDSGERCSSPDRSPPARGGCACGGKRGLAKRMRAAREPGGGFLALQPAQAGLEPLEVELAHDLVAPLRCRPLGTPAAAALGGLQRSFRVRGVRGAARSMPLPATKIGRLLLAEQRRRRNARRAGPGIGAQPRPIDIGAHADPPWRKRAAPRRAKTHAAPGQVCGFTGTCSAPGLFALLGVRAGRARSRG